MRLNQSFSWFSSHNMVSILNDLLTSFFAECQRRELPTVETRRVEVTSSQSDVLTVLSLFQRIRLSREWLSETSLKLLPSEICLKPLSTLNTLSQRPTTSCTTVCLVLSTPELSELDLELTEESELLHKDQDSTETTRFLQLTLPRKLYKLASVKLRYISLNILFMLDLYSFI